MIFVASVLDTILQLVYAMNAHVCFERTVLLSSSKVKKYVEQSEKIMISEIMDKKIIINLEKNIN